MEQASLQEQKENLFKDTLINFFMNNPSLYEKMKNEYMITVEKLDKLTTLSDFLKELSIHKKVPDIIRAWQELVRKFKEQLALENSAKSGSGAGNNNFPYFESLAFLRSAEENRESLSSISLSSTNTAKHGKSSSIHPNTSHSTASFSLATTMSQNLGTSKSSVSPKSLAAVTASCSSVNQSVSSTLVRKSLTVPEYDGFAKKKLKCINEDDESVNLMREKLMQTLDNVNKRAESLQQHEGLMESKGEVAKKSQAVDYRKLLSDAIENIPAGSENDLLLFVTEELEKFDQEFRINMN